MFRPVPNIHFLLSAADESLMANSKPRASEKPFCGPPVTFRIFEEKWWTQLIALDKKYGPPQTAEFLKPKHSPAFIRQHVARREDMLELNLCYDREAKPLGFTRNEVPITDKDVSNRSVFFLIEMERHGMRTFVDKVTSWKGGKKWHGYQWQELPLELRRRVNAIVQEVKSQDWTTDGKVREHVKETLGVFAPSTV